MTITVKDLAAGVGSGAYAVVYTAPSQTSAVIKIATFTNGDSLTAYTVSVKKNNGADVLLIGRQSLAAYESYASPELAGQTLEPGDTLSVNTNAAVYFSISGIEVV